MIRLFHLMRLLLLALLLACGTASAEALRLVFLDVGQGTATVLLTPDGRSALIDGGLSFRRLEAHLERLGIKKLDLIVASRAHADHIGGLVDAVRQYEPGAFIDNGLPNTTLTYLRLLQALEESDALYLEPFQRTITLGKVKIDVLPPPYLTDDQNNNSVGIRISYGDFSALLPGDASELEQDWWLQNHPELVGETEVYGAAHHGSETGDKPRFLASAKPQVIIISAGEDNRYSHPRPQALLNYEAATSLVFRTDQRGSLTIKVPQQGGVFYILPER